MATFKIVEPRSINDASIGAFCLAVQGMRHTLVEFIQYALAELERHPVTIPNRVALAILHRISEASLSAELLCLKGCVRDASIIVLTIFELQLDVSYIAQDVSRSSTWISHSHKQQKPWKVRNQMDAVYPDEPERDAECAIYRHLSMIKHGNPVGKTVSFGFAVDEHTMTLDTVRGNCQMLPALLFGLGSRIHKAIEAAAGIWASQGLSVGTFALTSKAECDSLSQLLEEHIIALLQRRKT